MKLSGMESEFLREAILCARLLDSSTPRGRFAVIDLGVVTRAEALAMCEMVGADISEQPDLSVSPPAMVTTVEVPIGAVFVRGRRERALSQAECVAISEATDDPA